LKDESIRPEMAEDTSESTLIDSFNPLPLTSAPSHLLIPFFPNEISVEDQQEILNNTDSIKWKYFFDSLVQE
jgi:hypothetical protein